MSALLVEDLAEGVDRGMQMGQGVADVDRRLAFVAHPLDVLGCRGELVGDNGAGVGAGGGVGHDATVALEDEVRECRMRDSFGGYDWGDPVVLWTWPRRPRFEFSVEQLAVAERVLGGAA